MLYSLDICFRRLSNTFLHRNNDPPKQPQKGSKITILYLIVPPPLYIPHQNRQLIHVYTFLSFAQKQVSPLTPPSIKRALSGLKRESITCRIDDLKRPPSILKKEG